MRNMQIFESYHKKVDRTHEKFVFVFVSPQNGKWQFMCINV